MHIFRQLIRQQTIGLAFVDKLASGSSQVSYERKWILSLFSLNRRNDERWGMHM